MRSARHNPPQKPSSSSSLEVSVESQSRTAPYLITNMNRLHFENNTRTIFCTHPTYRSWTHQRQRRNADLRRLPGPSTGLYHTLSSPPPAEWKESKNLERINFKKWNKSNRIGEEQHLKTRKYGLWDRFLSIGTRKIVNRGVAILNTNQCSRKNRGCDRDMSTRS